MEIVVRKIKELKFDPRNLRHHGVENIKMIKKSLSENTQYKPLIVDSRTDVVKIGHGRLQAMIELGWKECECVMLDFSEHEGLEVLDNRMNELSRWDDEDINDWLLNDKGVDWWGVDSQKSQELLREEKRRVNSVTKTISVTKKEKKIPTCPCCGKPLQKQMAVIL